MKTIHDELTYFLDRFLIGSQKHRRQMYYEPLKITFHMSSHISLCHPWMHFDGLVGHLLMISALGEDYFVLPRKFPFSRLLSGVEIPPFPIKENGMFHASISFFDINRQALEILYKRFEDRWAGGKRKISKASGYFKDYMIQHIYIPSRTVFFYVCGDKEVLSPLCRLIVSLGDNTRVGWGAVRSFTIEVMDEDWSIVKDGIAMRPIPEHLLEYTSEKIALGWRPPYWAPENTAICAPPGAEVILKEGLI